MKSIKENCYKGTRILLGNGKRELINNMIEILKNENFEEISIPILQLSDTFDNKVGEENQKMMFSFKDNGNRDICLSPEYTAVIQKLSKSYFKFERNKKVFYVQECFRGENPQKGRYRQFTQLGIEIVNPTENYLDYCIDLASLLLGDLVTQCDIVKDVTRGLDYYTNAKGFEIKCESLGAQKQICGGGEYDGGIGFALGIDRILLI